MFLWTLTCGFVQSGKPTPAKRFRFDIKINGRTAAERRDEILNNIGNYVTRFEVPSSDGSTDSYESLDGSGRYLRVCTCSDDLSLRGGFFRRLVWSVVSRHMSSICQANRGRGTIFHIGPVGMLEAVIEEVAANRGWDDRPGCNHITSMLVDPKFAPSEDLVRNGEMRITQETADAFSALVGLENPENCRNRDGCQFVEPLLISPSDRLGTIRREYYPIRAQDMSAIDLARADLFVAVDVSDNITRTFIDEVAHKLPDSVSIVNVYTVEGKEKNGVRQLEVIIRSFVIKRQKDGQYLTGYNGLGKLISEEKIASYSVDKTDSLAWLINFSAEIGNSFATGFKDAYRNTSFKRICLLDTGGNVLTTIFPRYSNYISALTIVPGFYYSPYFAVAKVSFEIVMTILKHKYPNSSKVYYGKMFGALLLQFTSGAFVFLRQAPPLTWRISSTCGWYFYSNLLAAGRTLYNGTWAQTAGRMFYNEKILINKTDGKYDTRTLEGFKSILPELIEKLHCYPGFNDWDFDYKSGNYDRMLRSIHEYHLNYIESGHLLLRNIAPKVEACARDRDYQVIKWAKKGLSFFGYKVAVGKEISPRQLNKMFEADLNNLQN